MKVIAVDFDDCLQHRVTSKPGEIFGEPITGSLEALHYLCRKYRVVIHTCVAHTPAGWTAVHKWLEGHNASYHEITAVKPIADIYLDNKGLRFTDWETALKDIKSILRKA